ncbi:hypothetical protein [Halomonas sp. THAF12]|uniref:AtuA-related protein n=1 Tax=Halomonas sp. THAF12 TaxID=2587849 RepID=UPI001268061F|nr:hypothetical protein [Halomonas sp. THAF12]
MKSRDAQASESSCGGLFRLYDVAHARSGDKGDRLNISLFPYNSDDYSLLEEVVTEEKVLEIFAHRGVSRVKRYLMPNIEGMNFVIDDVLQGGVNGALNLDGHGKSLSFLLLSMPMMRPRR